MGLKFAMTFYLHPNVLTTETDLALIGSMGIMTANQTGESRFNSLFGKGYAEAVVILSTEKNSNSLFEKRSNKFLFFMVFREYPKDGEKLHVFVFIYFTSCLFRRSH